MDIRVKHPGNPAGGVSGLTNNNKAPSTIPPPLVSWATKILFYEITTLFTMSQCLYIQVAPRPVPLANRGLPYLHHPLYA